MRGGEKEEESRGGQEGEEEEEGGGEWEGIRRGKTGKKENEEEEGIEEEQRLKMHTTKQGKLTDSLGIVHISCWFLSVKLTAER